VTYEEEVYLQISVRQYWLMCTYMYNITQYNFKVTYENNKDIIRFGLISAV